jgi:hypothetical protein
MPKFILSVLLTFLTIDVAFAVEVLAALPRLPNLNWIEEILPWAGGVGGTIVGLLLWLATKGREDESKAPEPPPGFWECKDDPEMQLEAAGGQRQTSGDDVDVTVFAPPIAVPGTEVVAQVIFHTLNREDEARERAKTVDPGSKTLATVPLTLPLNKGDQIKVSFDCLEVAVSEPIQCTHWNGRLVCLYLC